MLLLSVKGNGDERNWWLRRGSLLDIGADGGFGDYMQRALGELGGSRQRTCLLRRLVELRRRLIPTCC